MTASIDIALGPFDGMPRGGLHRIEALMTDADIVINALSWLERVGDKLRLVSRRLDEIVEIDPDVALASVHMGHYERPSIAHAVHMGILCSIVSRRMGHDLERRVRVISAALSCNASIIKLQDELYRQGCGPQPDQLTEVRRHPQKSVELLERTGVADPLWLDIVAQHHERPDGKGYPRGLRRDALEDESLMVGLADRYVACVSPRQDGMAQSPRRGLREVFQDPGYADVGPLVDAFVQELTSFPPGSFIRLSTRELAIVVRRGQTPLSPHIAVVEEALEFPSVVQIQDSKTQIIESLPAQGLSADLLQLWASG